MVTVRRDDGGLLAMTDVAPRTMEDMFIDSTRPLVVDLFAGAGGLSLGFEQAGYDVIASVELDPIHSLVHEFNFPYGTIFCSDVTAITGDEIREQSALGSREIHAVVGGAPCQGFSMIGKRQLDDPRNRLLGEFARLVIELQPRYFVLENVAGLTVGNHRRLLDEVIALFRQNGYEVRLPYEVLQAADFGVPQSRRRLFLMGAREGLTLPEYPLPQFTARTIKGAEPELSDGLSIGPSVHDALADLPDADEFDELLAKDSVQAAFRLPSDYAARLSGRVFDPTDLSHPRHFDPNRLTSSSRTVHTDKSVARFAATEPGTVEPVSRFLRLHPHGVSNTLRAGTASDRGAYTSPRPIHPWLSRVITVREAARLHGYPDWFRFHTTKWHGFRQIGNSVPPPLARAVASQLLKADNIVLSPGVAVSLGSEGLLSATATEAERYFGITERVIPQRDRKTG